MKKIILLLLLTVCCIKISFSQENIVAPKAFLSIDLILGRHNVRFKTFADTPGFSFGFKVNAGIYLVNKSQYRGGLQFTLMEGASNHKDRRDKSEKFDLPNKDFDKHIVYKFAMFRSSNVGWFSEWKASEKVWLFHQFGLGIFGLTENNPLFNLGMHNHIGILTGKSKDDFRLRIGVSHDLTIGNGNPNYSISNLGFSVGGLKRF
jgi:hypothetical protein